MTYAAELAFAGAAGAALVALAGLIRARRSAAGGAFLLGMLLFAFENICIGFTALSSSAADALFWQQWKLLALSLQPGLWLVFSLGYARGNAREFLKKWRIALAGACLVPLAVAALQRPSLIVSLQPAAGGSDWSMRLGWAGLSLQFLVLLASVFIVMNLERTFRASIGIMRWRIKFMVFGVGMLFIVRIYTSSQALLFHGTDVRLDTVDTGALLISALLIPRAFWRSGQLDLDIYPSRSVLEGSVTVVLAGAYLLIMGALARFAAHFGGSAEFPLQAFLVLVALVLLALLLQSDRLRLRLRRFVSRHFQRPFYDYRTAWKSFTDATASCVEQADLCRSLGRLIADMLQALSVTLWLVDERRENLTFAASTSISEVRARELAPTKVESANVIAHFQHQVEPVDYEVSTEAWAVALQRCNPSEFVNGGSRVCVPMTIRGELLGVIAVGDRVGGARFSLQDFDLLKCIGDQAAASLYNVHLSRRLIQAKELEAFQAMAAFFVHDLKNAASTLNLMLENLPEHYDDPAFREDALRGISNTVGHIDHLVGRLTALRRELKIQPAEGDLNEIVDGVLAGLASRPHSHLTKELDEMPKFQFDREQISKVVTNLVLNATEAVNDSGSVRVATRRNGGWAVLTVADNGCGMSADFVRRSLFRPFQTTKKRGLGIGMFQSLMIVQAHGGRIAVESEPGKGTTFQVFLPVAGPLS